MLWHDELRIKWAAQAAHEFLLHLNTPDLVLDAEKFHELNDYLLLHPPCRDAAFVATFTRAGGIRFLGKQGEKEFLKFLGKLQPHKTNTRQADPDAVNRFRNNRMEISCMVGLFSEMLGIGWNGHSDDVKTVFEECFGKDRIKGAEKSHDPFFVVILDQMELLVPPRAQESSCQDDRSSLSACLEWAKNSKIAQARNLVLMITEDMGEVSPKLTSDTRAMIPVEIPFLSMPDRKKTIDATKKEFPGAELGITSDEFARISNGLSRRAMVQIVREAVFKRQKLDGDIIFKRKQAHLKTRVRDIGSLFRSIWGADAIGGMEHNKDYALGIADAMRRGDTFGIPQNVIFVGPKGTGKTVLAQAVSYHSGTDLLIIENPRNMFVGESERRMRYILQVAKSYAPLIIFIDEFHLFVLRQGTYFSGDSGVTENIQGQLLEVMSDTDLRGQLFFIAATNHPELVDDAFIRPGRIDDVRVFLPPFSDEERAKIVPAILHKLSRQAEVRGEKFRHELSEEFFLEVGKLAHAHYQEGEGWLECSDETHQNPDTFVGFTGAEIEFLITHAHDKRARKLRRPLLEEDISWAASDFMPNRNMPEFNASIDAALRLCNSMESIPPEWRKRAREVKGRRVDADNTSISSSINTGQYL